MSAGESYRSAKKRRRLVVGDALAAAAGTSTEFHRPPTKKLRIRFKGPEHAISRLGNDLIEEILIRLPNPRSASRCKPVCRRWNSMISSPSFNRRFVSHHQSKNREPPLLLSADDPLSSSMLSFLPVPREFRSKFIVWDSFKDLLLCGFKDWGRSTYFEMGRLFFLCNPFTEQWVALPLAPERITRRYRTAEVRLVCEEVGNSKTSLDMGDGQAFVYSSDYRFRVLLAYEARSMTLCDFELYVFCSKSRRWSRRKNLRLQTDAASSNGKLYWKCQQEICSSDPSRRNMRPITIDEMEFMEFSYGSSLRFSHLSSSDGGLYIIQLEPKLSDQQQHGNWVPPSDRDVFRVWKWEEGSMKWTMCYEALLGTMKRNSGSEVEDLEVVSVLAQHPNKPEIFFLKCYRKPRSVVFSCNFRTRKIELLSDRIPYKAFKRWIAFQPRTTCFATSIPSYGKLLDMYNGRVHGLVQKRKST